MPTIIVDQHSIDLRVQTSNSHLRPANIIELTPFHLFLALIPWIRVLTVKRIAVVRVIPWAACLMTPCLRVKLVHIIASDQVDECTLAVDGWTFIGWCSAIEGLEQC